MASPSIAIFEYVDSPRVEVTPTNATVPPFIVYATREEAPLGIPSTWICWAERGSFRIANVTASSWHEARRLGAAALGELIEYVDATREMRLKARFGERA